MKVEYYRDVSYAAVWSWRFMLVALSLCISIFFFYQKNLILGRYLYLFISCVSILCLLSIILSVLGFSDLWRFGDLAGRYSLLGGGGSFILLGFMFILFWRAYFLPQLSFIATDFFEDSNLFNQNIFKLSSPLLLSDTNVKKGTVEVQQVQRKYWPNITTKFYDRPAGQIFQAIILLLDEKGLSVMTDGNHAPTKKLFLIETEGTFFPLGPINKTIIRILAEGEKSRLDIVSYSKKNPDFGINAHFVEKLLHDIDQNILL